MNHRDIVVIGASAGGIEALKTLVGGLPPDYCGSIFVVLHTSPHSPGVLGEILDRAGKLAAANATDGEAIKPNHIYVAPRSIEESVMLMRHVAEHLKNGDTPTSERFLRQADEAQQRAEIFRQAAMRHEKISKEKYQQTENQ